MSKVKELEMSLMDYVTEVGIICYRHDFLKDILHNERDELIRHRTVGFMDYVMKTTGITDELVEELRNKVSALLDHTSADDYFDICSKKFTTGFKYKKPVVSKTDWRVFRRFADISCMFEIKFVADKMLGRKENKPWVPAARPTVEQWNMYIPERPVENQAELELALESASPEELMILDNEVNNE